MSDPEALIPLVQRFCENDPASAAKHLQTLDEERAAEVLSALPPSIAARMVQYFADPFAAGVVQRLSAAHLRDVADFLDAQEAAGLFLCLPAESRPMLLEYLSDKKKKEVQEILTYPEDSAGRIMSTDFLAYHADLSVLDAVHKIRQAVQRGTKASYVYVVDSRTRLLGVLNMRDLVVAEDHVSLGSIVRPNMFTVNCFMDREQVVQELSNRHFFAAPVVDAENRLLGVVRAEQLLDDVQEEATEDLQKMFGASGDERPFSPIRFSLRTRLPWLHINLVTAFLAGAVVAVFQNFIGKFPVLAIYLPVIAGQGGNAGAQSLAVVMRGIVMREIPARKIAKLIFKETWIGMLNGITIGVVTALAAWLWQGNPTLGLVVGLGMFVNLAVAGLSGAAIPITMKAVGLDPAQCSNIILTTITDVMGFLAFLGFAYLFQSHLG